MSKLFIIRCLSQSSINSTFCLYVHRIVSCELACLPQDGSRIPGMSHSYFHDGSFNSSLLQNNASSPKRSCLSLSPELRAHIAALVRANPCALNSPLSEPRPPQPCHMESDSVATVSSLQCPSLNTASSLGALQSPSMSLSALPTAASAESGSAGSHRHRRRRPRRRHLVSDRAASNTNPGGVSVNMSESFGLEQLFAGVHCNLDELDLLIRLDMFRFKYDLQNPRF